MRKTTEELADIADAEFDDDDALFTNTEEWLETFRRLVIENERECAEPATAWCAIDEGGAHLRWNKDDRHAWHPLFTFPPAAQVPEWQPIETAPKELGKRILGLKDCGEGTLTSISIVFWLNDGEWHINDCAPRTAEGFGYRVTHWMPLPAAPEVKHA